MWLGYGFKAGNAYFSIPAISQKEYANGVYDNKTGLVKFRNCTWFTNLDHKKRHEEMILWKSYKAEEYPKYDNYDAIEVSKTGEIPMDYEGVMGVPITFLDKYCPEQFEIIGEMVTTKKDDYNFGYPYINGNKKYARVLIRRKKGE